jgi:integrase
MKTDLPYVQKFKDRHGKIRTYYRRSGLRQRIDGKPGSAEWLSDYMRIHKSFETAPRAVPDHESFRYAVSDYLSTQRYLSLAPNTRANYRSMLDELSNALGDQRLSDFSRGDIIKIRDKIAQRSNARAELAVKTMKMVFERACDVDTIDRNPAKGVRKPDGYKSTPHRSWTDDELALFRERARPHVRRAMLVLLYTGLRCSDALQLKRGAIDNGAIAITTQKAKTDVVIPLHSELKEELATPLPVESIYLICGARGKALGRHALLAMFRREFDALGVPRNQQPTTHGLRKNAVSALVEAGCSPREIQAVTGQSLPIIEHYAREYDRKQLAASAIHKLEGKT